MHKIALINYVTTLVVVNGYLCSATGLESAEKQLYTDVFSNYNNQLRPVTTANPFQQIVIQIQFSVNQIEGLSEKEEQLVSHGTMSIIWTDQLLQWNASHYNGISSLAIKAEEVWLPEMTAINSNGEAGDLASDKNDVRMRVYANGLVTWIPLIAWKTVCQVDVTDFPFDEQQCKIRYASWMYAAALVNYSVTEEVLVNTVDSDSEWKLLSATAYYEGIIYAGTEHPSVTLEVNLKRNPRFFEIYIILPSLLLSFLLIPMFVLPVESGEKVSLGITLMLAYSIFLVILTEYSPQSGSIPHLSIAMAVAIAFSGVGLCTNILIINIHYHKPNKQVPTWIKRIIIGKVGSFLCCMKHQKTEQQVSPESQQSKSDTEDLTCKSTAEKPLSHTEFQKLLSYLEFFKTKKLDEEQTDDIAQDWHHLARVLDRIFLLLYAIYFLVFLFVVLSFRWR